MIMASYDVDKDGIITGKEILKAFEEKYKYFVRSITARSGSDFDLERAAFFWILKNRKIPEGLLDKADIYTLSWDSDAVFKIINKLRLDRSELNFLIFLFLNQEL